MARGETRTAADAGLTAEADAVRRFVDLVSHRAGAALSLMENANVTLAQVLLMTRVEDAGATSISELAKVSPGSPGAMSQMVDRLVRQNWLARSEDANDRRRKTVSLTAAGRRLLRDLERARARDYATGISCLRPALRAELRECLERALAEMSVAL